MISVVIPCYNQGKFLNATLNSVLLQTHIEWECIIVNDGSTDETEQIAKSYCDKDKRFIYHKKVNGGLSSARNAGLELAHGEYIQFLDSDDLISPEKFEIQLNSLIIQDAEVLVCDYNLFMEDLNNQFENHLSIQPYILTLDGFIYNWINLDFVIAIHSGLFNRNFLIKNNIRFNESVKALEDWIFWCTLAKENARFNHQTQKLAYYRVQNGSMTNDLSRMRTAFIKAAFIVEDLLPDDKKEEYKNKMTEILVNLLTKSFGESDLAYKANSPEYKLGYFLFYPIRKIQTLGNKTLKKIKKGFEFSKK